eukprot:SAG11_NODE_1117_length_5798_cov_10.203194_6_plen_120_part_00
MPSPIAMPAALLCSITGSKYMVQPMILPLASRLRQRRCFRATGSGGGTTRKGGEMSAAPLHSRHKLGADRLHPVLGHLVQGGARRLVLFPTAAVFETGPRQRNGKDGPRHERRAVVALT